mmetsp:Transcript_21016/g.44785  ORF Transcript_21016/g.44785 Transcript_21016/m.44785 type:complete len:222 (-) Transcript_21016:85-750(-)
MDAQQVLPQGSELGQNTDSEMGILPPFSLLSTSQNSSISIGQADGDKSPGSRESEMGTWGRQKSSASGRHISFGGVDVLEVAASSSEDTNSPQSVRCLEDSIQLDDSGEEMALCQSSTVVDKMQSNMERGSITPRMSQARCTADVPALDSSNLWQRRMFGLGSPQALPLCGPPRGTKGLLPPPPGVLLGSARGVLLASKPPLRPGRTCQGWPSTAQGVSLS